MVAGFCIFGGVLTGSFMRVFWGWFDSGESFNSRKFLSTVIPTIFLALPMGTAAYAANINASGIGLVSITVTELLAGWGIDDGIKQITKMQSNQSKNKP